MPTDAETAHLTTQLLVSGTTLLVLLWISFTLKEKAGYWWVATGIGLCADGFVVAVGRAPEWVELIAGDGIGPLVGYLFYRGVAAYVDQPPHWLAAVWTAAMTALWFALLPTHASLSLYIVMAVQIPLMIGAIHLFWRTQKTPLGTLLIYGAVALAVFVASAPWIRDSSNAHDARSGEIEFWLSAMVPIVLVLICALLDRNLSKTRQAFEEQAEMLSLAATQAGLGTWTYSTRTEQVKWSDEMWTIYKADREQEPMSLQTQARLVAHEDRLNIARKLQRALEYDEPLAVVFPIQLPDGSRRFISSNARAITRPDGERIVVGSTLDMTEQRDAIEELQGYRNHLEDLVKQRTVELNQSRQQLIHSERLASLGTLTAGLAHQVNNPVGAIQAAADFAKRCKGDADELEVLHLAIADIEEEASRCGIIVRGMLQFASAQPTKKTLIPIDELLHDLWQSLSMSEKRYGATLSLENLENGPTVSVCRLEIEQALTNLVMNAFQSRESGVDVRIVRLRQKNNVVIDIEDNGPGIRAELLDRILEPFYTSRLGEGGTGLGLSIAHGVAQTHGGNLAISSTLGVGTRARLTLPISFTPTAGESAESLA